VERIETWFLAVYKGRFVPNDGALEPKNQVSKITKYIQQHLEEAQS
jgi:hypothetical protein